MWPSDGLTLDQLNRRLHETPRKSGIYSLSRIEGLTLNARVLTLEQGVRLIDHDAISDPYGKILRGDATLPAAEGMAEGRITMIEPYSLAGYEHGRMSYSFVHSVWSRVYLETKFPIDLIRHGVWGNEIRPRVDDAFQKLNDALSIISIGGWRTSAHLVITKSAQGGILMPVRSEWFNLPGDLRSYGKQAVNLEKGGILKRIYSAMPRKNVGSVAIALQRLRVGRERSDRSDRLIDSCIGLEALFSTHDGTENKREICIRGATFLGKKGELKEEYERISNVFKARNEIVHGKQYNNEKVDKISFYALEKLRQALFKVFTDTVDFNRKSFLDGLDSRMFWRA